MTVASNIVPPLRRGASRLALGLALAIAAAWALGCADSVKPPVRHADLDPETELTYAPVENDSAYFRVHLYWSGTDRDGEVTAFRFATDADTALPVTQWKSTAAHDTTLLFAVDPVQASAVHAFMISALDNEGRFDRTPAKRVFSTKTVPPTSQITKGPAAFNPTVPATFTFEWSGTDPDGIEIGRAAPVDSFEYLLLQLGASAEPGHPPLPPFDLAATTALINQATGRTLPPPYDDWKWAGIRGEKKRFEGTPSGEYVFAERAIDVAGAAETSLEFLTNIRHFVVASNSPSRPTGPRLSILTDTTTYPVASAMGPVDPGRTPLQFMEGETVVFSWSATADAYGGHVTGYTYALDDTSALPPLSLSLTLATFTPARLTRGLHTLYVRAVDDLGLVT
ncbi:MAG: hypothetical protein ACRENN_07590, partial [Candidatus Eiseniibacteriota bacterium]